jgi:hypothetical protein
MFDTLLSYSEVKEVPGLGEPLNQLVREMGYSYSNVQAIPLDELTYSIRCEISQNSESEIKRISKFHIPPLIKTDHIINILKNYGKWGYEQNIIFFGVTIPHKFRLHLKPYRFELQINYIPSTLITTIKFALTSEDNLRIAMSDSRHPEQKFVTFTIPKRTNRFSDLIE